MRQTRLYFMLTFRNNSAAPNLALAEVFAILKRKGYLIEIGIAESLLLRPEELSVKHDLYILKSHTDLWLSLAGGEELKVYVIGDEVFAMRQPPSRNGCARPRAACPVSPRVRRIALRCGQVSGLGLYGVDMVEGPDGPVVVDLNYFPSYRGVPKAAPLIADYIEDYTKEHCPTLAVSWMNGAAA